MYREFYADEFSKRGISVRTYGVGEIKRALREAVSLAAAGAGNLPAEKVEQEIRERLLLSMPAELEDAFCFAYLIARGSMSGAFDFMRFYDDRQFVTSAVEDSEIARGFGPEGIRIDGIAEVSPA